MTKSVSQLHSNFDHSSGFEKVLAPGISSAKIVCQKYHPTFLSFPIPEKTTVCLLHTYVTKEHKPVTNHSLPSVRPQTSLFLYTKAITDHLQSGFFQFLYDFKILFRTDLLDCLFSTNLCCKENPAMSKVKNSAYWEAISTCSAWPGLLVPGEGAHP